MTRQVAIVTGGASGIGEATVRQLAAEGFAVAILDLKKELADSVASSVSSSGGQALAIEVDVSDEEAIESAIEEVVAKLGVATVLVNCAGILHVSPALETSTTAFDRVIRVNLRSVFVTTLAVVRRVVDAGLPGSIVNVSSIHAVLSEPNASAYTAAKGGIEAMSRTFASEWAEHNIRVNTVRPGATRTALTEDLYTEEVLLALKQRIPMSRPAGPEEVAAGICFLASDKASYITGTTLDIDGGYIMDGSLPNAKYS